EGTVVCRDRLLPEARATVLFSGLSPEATAFIFAVRIQNLQARFQTPEIYLCHSDGLSVRRCRIPRTSQLTVYANLPALSEDHGVAGSPAEEFFGGRPHVSFPHRWHGGLLGASAREPDRGGGRLRTPGCSGW